MTKIAKAVTYNVHGGPEVLTVVEREVPNPAKGQILVNIVASGINPTDWKNRQGTLGAASNFEVDAVPHHDGAGTVAAIGEDVEGFALGDRVWVVLAAYGNPGEGTAQEFAAITADRVFHLPDEASFDQGASIGIPALTAHRALTVAEDGPRRLAPGALAGITVLVPGGAGAVGHAAIQLGVWAGATVITTVSSSEKAALARSAGAHHVFEYTQPGLVERIRQVSPAGVDLIVEVAASANSELNSAVLATRGTIAMYGNDRGGPLTISFGESLALNARYQFVLLYTVGSAATIAGAQDINRALVDGALAVGEGAGLPLHRFTIEDTAEAHRAVERGVTGKVLVDL
jgi:NADPH2:quinone reductase